MTSMLWHILFRLVKLDWVPSRSISDMMTLSRGLGSININDSSLIKPHFDLDCMMEKNCT